MSHLQKNNILSDRQHGYRSGCSTETQLLKVINYFAKGLENYKQIECISLDFRRAFDTVPHQRLLGKLSHYGINGNVNRWIEAFLSGRTMQVVVDGETSKAVPVTSGVPQGTVLGPVLFLVLISDIADGTDAATRVSSFADDTRASKPILVHSDSDQLHPRWQ